VLSRGIVWRACAVVEMSSLKHPCFHGSARVG
jgi:hypothetical protein